MKNWKNSIVLITYLSLINGSVLYLLVIATQLTHIYNDESDCHFGGLVIDQIMIATQWDQSLYYLENSVPEFENEFRLDTFFSHSS